ncbi:PREDICTED: myb-like protein W [Drosophila arizonae]|uniref:Myb-like protein W n=1 Tax=Drosophila arizonae TaxID=7263 RepID=A0ABM1NP66_DROAR|nr:PREDICTED: myb-like protein W [Drosophila arizonae]
MSTSNTNMSCNWIILIFLHGILAVQSKKVIARANLNSEDENKIQKKMTALIDTQSGHYENNYEYLFFVTELIVSRLSKKSISAKKSDIKKFQTYNNRRLYLEEQIDNRVDRVNFEMLSLPYGHTCKDFYMQQKSALENAYTKKNSVKQDILNENSKNCPSTNDSDGRNSYNNNNNEQNDNDNPKNDIIENIDAHINSALGHYQNNMEYNERLNDLYMAKQSDWRSSHIVLAVNKFHHYNTRRLELEKQIESHDTRKSVFNEKLS